MGREAVERRSRGIEALLAVEPEDWTALPSLDELRGKLIGLLQAPAARVARVLQAPAGQVARLLAAHAEGQSESSA